jgi:hypothetical protein
MTLGSPSENVRTFRINSLLRMLAPGIATFVFMLVVIYILIPADQRQIIGLLAAILALAIALAAWLSTRARLAISEEGITYYGIGYRVRSSWENVKGYAKRAMGVNSVECLILHEPGMEMAGWLSLAYKALPVFQVLALVTGQPVQFDSLDGLQDAIPVSLFAENWRSSEIGDLVKRYAAQAFDNPVI